MIKLTILFLLPIIYCIENQQHKPLAPVNFGFKSRFGQSLNTNEIVCQNASKYGFTPRSGTNKYYAIADIFMNWIEAENYCQSFGAHLPIPKNMDDVNFFRCILYLK